MDKRLHVGFLVSSDFTVQAWRFETIKVVAASGCRLVFIGVDTARSQPPAVPVFYSFFKRFENWWFKSDYAAEKLVSLEGFRNDSSFLSISTDGISLSASDKRAVEELKLDVLYAASHHPIEAERFSDLATYGLWSVQFGYGHYASKQLPAFWEVMENNPVTGSYLLVHKNGQRLVAYEGTTRTVPYSVKNNFSSVAFKSSSYLAFRLCTLQHDPASFLQNLTPFEPPASATKTTIPRNAAMAFFFFRNLVRYALYKIHGKLERNTFTILYSFSAFDVNAFDALKFKPVTLPDRNRFYADPFVIKKDGIHHVFFEEMVYSLNKAHISVLTIDSNRCISAPEIVLERPYHLSYPFVFEHDGDYYMIPETAANRTVEIYKAVRFPGEWQFVMNLMEDVILLDVTLCFHNNRWWLFANSHTHPIVSTNDQLFVFSSKELFSKAWEPHPWNPVVTHAGNCRPAGRIFKEGNKIYRPAQNNASQQYGHALVLNEIEILNEEHYKEREVPFYSDKGMGLKACHHIDVSDGLVVIDGIPR